MITSAPHPFFISKKLSPLLVIPLIDICPSEIFNIGASVETIFDLYFEIFGVFNTIEASILTMVILLGINDIIFFNNLMLETFLVFGVLGKCSPMSPKFNAPHNASIIACVKTSPSECAMDFNLHLIL